MDRSLNWHVSVGPGYGMRILGPSDEFPANLRVNIEDNEVIFTPLTSPSGNKFIRLWKVTVDDGCIDIEPADPMIDVDFYVIIFKGFYPHTAKRVTCHGLRRKTCDSV